MKLLNFAWQPGWEGSVGKDGHRYIYSEPLCSLPEITTILSLLSSLIFFLTD